MAYRIVRHLLATWVTRQIVLGIYLIDLIVGYVSTAFVADHLIGSVKGIS